MKLTIATRQSKLALWQSHWVKSQLEHLHPGIQVELLGITTKGDKTLDVSLTKIGGKGLFVKELENALLDGKADIAVHSLKDVPMFLPEGLLLETICKRHDAHDVLIANKPIQLDTLPDGFVVGTSSLRRQCQLLHKFPNIKTKLLRGNVNTRLRKLIDGEFDAIVLAKAGVDRLNLETPHQINLPFNLCLPCAGQGALGIECREDDAQTKNLLKSLHDLNTAKTVLAERAMVRALNGDCKTPIGAYAELDGNTIQLTGMVGMIDGSKILSVKQTGLDADALGQSVANELISLGADRIIEFS